MPDKSIQTALKYLPVKEATGGAILTIRLTPKGGSNRIEKVVVQGEDSYLKVRVSVPPEDGKANAALIETLAAWLNMPKSEFNVAAGRKSRRKTVSIAGNPEKLLSKITALLSQLGRDAA